MGVFKAFLYAHKASPNFFDQSFLEMFTVFCKINLISLLVSSTFPLVLGWYGDAILRLTSYLARAFLKAPCVKCDPPSVMRYLGTPNLEKITSLSIFKDVL